ncbi:MAG: hypothetical protein QM831_27725 [Kofleriaceae bacterium]
MELPPGIAKLYALGRATASDPDGHGTRVCEVVRAQASKATLLVQSIFDDYGGLSGIPFDRHELLYPPYADGARIHCNAWFEGTNDYTQDAFETDAFVAQHRDLVVVSAGTAARNAIVSDTPATTSANAAAMREYLALEGTKRPSAALVRALLAIGDASSIQQATVIRYRDEDTKLDTGDAIAIAMGTPAGRPVEVVLAWTDLPGYVLQNELVLEVSVGGTSIEGEGSANVRRATTQGGSIVATVKCRRALAPQSFALVICSR